MAVAQSIAEVLYLFSFELASFEILNRVRPIHSQKDVAVS